MLQKGFCPDRRSQIYIVRFLYPIFFWWIPKSFGEIVWRGIKNYKNGNFCWLHRLRSCRGVSWRVCLICVRLSLHTARNLHDDLCSLRTVEYSVKRPRVEKFFQSPGHRVFLTNLLIPWQLSWGNKQIPWRLVALEIAVRYNIYRKKMKPNENRMLRNVSFSTNF